MIEEVQSVQIFEPESIAIMSRERELRGPSSEVKEFKTYFSTLTEMVKVLYEERNTRMVGESSKPPYGEGSSESKKDENKVSKGNGGKPPPSPPLIQMENGINPWYSSTHIIHQPMEFTHGIVNGIRPWYCKIHPWYSFTHGIDPWYCN